MIPLPDIDVIADYFFKFFQAIFDFYRNAYFNGGSLLWLIVGVGIVGAVITYFVRVAHTR